MQVACGRLGSPESEGELVLGMVPEPVIQYYDGSPTEGFTKDFAQLFGEHIGLPVRIQLAADYEELATLALEGKVHVAAYVNATPENSKLKFSVPIGTRPLWVVKLVNAPGPKTLADLAGLEIQTPVGSAAAMALKSLGPSVVPKVVEVRYRDEMDIFEDLAEGRIPFVAVDELYMQYAANTYPDLQPAVQLPGNRVFAWALPPRGSDALREKLDAFIIASQKDGKLSGLEDRYFSYIKRLNAYGAQAFISDIETKLPRFRSDFHKAQEATGIDWRQLAALAYQESKWEPNAVSFTGVRGMMMLTDGAAKETGIKNKNDPAQSISGGSRYLLSMMERIPDSAKQPDRLWLALAAYNIGLGHVHSGRKLAERLRRDPDSWFEMKTVLPLLARPQYYSQMKTGRCRGGEAVILVENVRSFYGILANIEPAHVPPKLASKTAAKSTSQAAPSKLRKKRNRAKP